MKNLKTALTIVLILSFTACDKIAENIANDNTFKLSRKLWTFDSVSGFDDLINQEVSTFLTGNTYNFTINGTYTKVLQGQSTEGEWEFNIDETVVILDKGTADQMDWTIVTLSETLLTVTVEDTDALNGTYTLNYE